MIPKWPQISQGAAMRRDDICIYVSLASRAQLEAIIADRSAPQKHVWRAKVITNNSRRGREAVQKNRGEIFRFPDEGRGRCKGSGASGRRKVSVHAAVHNTFNVQRHLTS